MKSIVLGGGCFWCTEAIFQKIPGVIQVTSGYSGGKTQDPTYDDICSGDTGHAEVVKIDYNPEEIGLKKLLLLFFKTHDPTTYHRQGADVGSQYRSIILYEDEEQRAITENAIEDIAQAGIYDEDIVTEVLPLDKFWEAEAYHQDFYAKNPGYGYCSVVINPKLKKLEEILGKM